MPLTSIIWVIHNKHYLGHPHCTHSPHPTWGAHHYHHPHMGLGQYSAVKKREVAQCRSFTSPTASTHHPNGIPLWHSPQQFMHFGFLAWVSILLVAPFALWTSPLWEPTTWLLSLVLFFPYTLQLPTFIVWGLAGIAATPI